MAEISLWQLEKRYGPTAVLKGVSLDVRDGEFLTLVGPSGCGKSTLLRIIAGLEPQDSGEVRIGDLPVDGLRPKERDVAMVFQSYALYPHMSVYDNMCLPLRMRRMNALQRLPVFGPLVPGARSLYRSFRAEVDETARLLDIGHLLHRRPGQLSGGQRQRVALGRAMVRHPAVFLMDEPLSNLDAKLRVQMRTEIAGLHRRLGTTFVYVTHDQAEAMTMSDRVAVMTDGDLVQIGSPGQVYDDPDDLRVAEFIGSPKINVVGGREARAIGLLRALDAERDTVEAVSAESEIAVAFRPEAAELTSGTGGGPYRGVLRGQVVHVEHLGAEAFVHIALHSDPTGCVAAPPIVVRLDGRQRHSVALDETVGVKPDPARLLCFGPDGRRLRPFEWRQAA